MTLGTEAVLSIFPRIPLETHAEEKPESPPSPVMGGPPVGRVSAGSSE